MSKMMLSRATVAGVFIGLSMGAATAAHLDVLDTKPPVLRQLSLRGTLDVQKADATAHLEVRASDAASGVRDVYIVLNSPSGNSFVSLYVTAALPQRQFRQNSIIGTRGSGLNAPFGPWAEAGFWPVRHVLLIDAAGNQVVVPGSTLAANGWSDRLKVQNSTPDGQPPVLISGRLGVSEVSLSANAPGVTRAPYVHAGLNVSDAGSQGAAGVSFASLRLCRSNDVTCTDAAKVLNLYGHGFGRGQKAQALTVAGQPIREGESPQLPAHELGDYRIVQVLLRDNAGNETTLQSTDTGGSTDFSTLFGSTIFTLKP